MKHDFLEDKMDDGAVGVCRLDACLVLRNEDVHDVMFWPVVLGDRRCLSCVSCETSNNELMVGRSDGAVLRQKTD